jgi:hypothetical protein
MPETRQRDTGRINEDTSGGKTGGDDQEEQARNRMGAFRHNHTAEPVEPQDKQRDENGGPREKTD